MTERQYGYVTRSDRLQQAWCGLSGLWLLKWHSVWHLTLGLDTCVAWEGVALHAVRNKIPHLDTHSSQILTPDQRPMPRRSHFTASDSILLEHGARKGVPGNKPGSLPKAQVFLLANGWDSKHLWGSCHGLPPPSPGTRASGPPGPPPSPPCPARNP